MPFESINPPQFPTPIAPYSAGTKAGKTVYVSGTLALGEGGSVLHPGDCAAQTRHVLETIRITLEAAGAIAGRRRLQPYLPDRLGRLSGDERGLCGIFPGREAGALLHPVRAGEARPASSRSPAWRISADAARGGPLLRGAWPAGRAAADPLVRASAARRPTGRRTSPRSRSIIRVILYDHRGTGRSDRELPDTTVDRHGGRTCSP